MDLLQWSLCMNKSNKAFWGFHRIVITLGLNKYQSSGDNSVRLDLNLGTLYLALMETHQSEYLS